MFSSCYGYKNVDLSKNKIIALKKHKIKTKGGKKIKAFVYNINKDSIFLIENETKTRIALAEIKQIKERKFSHLKTIGFPLIYIGLIVLTISEWSPTVNIGTIESPN
tara:strand:- start:3426 stop:3746 length:321 start_codon:yes stop_codon:yes gene_type:complete